MTTLPTPNGATGNMFFEPLLRQFVAYQLKQIAENVNDPSVTFIDELFGRYGDDVRLQVKEWFATRPNISVEINFPREDSKLPFIAVVAAEENEKTNETLLDDHGGEMFIGGRSVTSSSSQVVQTAYTTPLAEPDDRPRALQVRRLISIPETRVTRLYIATDDVNLTLYLYTVIKALLVVNKLDFDKYAGARNLKLSGSDFDHKAELFPQFAYFKVLTLAYDMNFDVPLSPTGTIGGVDVSFTSTIGSL